MIINVKLVRVVFAMVKLAPIKRQNSVKWLLMQKTELYSPFPNKAVENVKKRFKQEKREYLREICYTFDSYFYTYHNRDISDLENKTIFIEEYSMVRNRWMTKIYETFTK